MRLRIGQKLRSLRPYARRRPPGVRGGAGVGRIYAPGPVSEARSPEQDGRGGLSRPRSNPSGPEGSRGPAPRLQERFGPLCGRVRTPMRATPSELGDMSLALDRFEGVEGDRLAFDESEAPTERREVATAPTASPAMSLSESAYGGRYRHVRRRWALRLRAAAPFGGRRPGHRGLRRGPLGDLVHEPVTRGDRSSLCVNRFRALDSNYVSHIQAQTTDASRLPADFGPMARALRLPAYPSRATPRGDAF